MTKTLFTKGIDLDDNQMPAAPVIQCGHTLRLDLLNYIISKVQQCYHLYGLLSPTTTKWMRIPNEDVIKAISTGLEGYAKADLIRSRLASSKGQCCRCRLELQKQLDLQTATQEDSSSSSNLTSDEEGQDSDEKEDLIRSTLPTWTRTHKVLKKVLKGARQRATMALRTPTTRKAGAIALKPQRFQLLRRNKHIYFDDYYDRPTLEDMRELWPAGGLEGYPSLSYGQPTIRSPWELFRDYGYSLEPEFALMFNQQQPLRFVEHLLPLGEGAIKEEKPKHSDCRIMGMEEMLSMAPPEGTIDSMNMFVRGVLPDGLLIELDPKRDKVPLDEEGECLLSYDLDSVNWTTYHLQVKTEISVHVLPYTGPKPPIWKSNHAYAEILMPQSQQDQDEGHRSEWFTNRKSLSAIPHIHFAKLGQGASSFNISVMFPRMMHKNLSTGRSATLIPLTIQELWFTEVVYPAIEACENPSTLPYKHYTLEEWRWKSIVNNRFSGKDTLIVVQGKNLPKLQNIMRRRAEEDEKGDLDRFKSFFFCMEMKGSKGSTNVVVGDRGNPYEELRKKFPHCDWEYMEKRENGQLLVDMGMGFHPEPRDLTPLVFLWDLEEVNSSYDAAGMNAGRMHHPGLLGRYGGRQAEMERTRMAIVQLCFRSTYSLTYQPFRRSVAGEINFCEDIDAYEVNSKYRSCIEGHLKMMYGSMEKSFGAREEVRGSGTAVRQAMEETPDMVDQIFVSYPCL